MHVCSYAGQLNITTLVSTLNSVQTAIRFYRDTQKSQARLNPYADVETLFSSKKNGLAAALLRKQTR